MSPKENDIVPLAERTGRYRPIFSRGWMRRRGRIHFTNNECSDAVLDKAAELIRTDRRETKYGAIRPGLVEYIDLLRVVTELHEGDHDKQLQSLDEVSQFVRCKQGKVF